MYANRINVAAVAIWAQEYDGYHLSEEIELITDLPNAQLEHESSWIQYERW